MHNILIEKDEIIESLIDRWIVQYRIGFNLDWEYWDKVIYDSIKTADFVWDGDHSLRFNTKGFESIPAGVYVITFNYFMIPADSTGLRFVINVKCDIHARCKYSEVLHSFNMNI